MAKVKAIGFKNSVHHLFQAVNHLLWPALCLNCRSRISETDKGLCRTCWDALLRCTGGYYCKRCGRDATPFSIINGTCPACQGLDHQFDSVCRAGIYGESLRDLILSFKNSHCQLDTLLGGLADAALDGSDFRDEIDYYVPVPLHWRRRLRRGYNQSLLIATHINRKIINTDLVRIRNTAIQVSMISPSKRRRNVEGAFAVRKDHNFEGKNICLIDDIKTTGATLNECAKTLKHVGAKKVCALVLAVAGQNT